jgi:hypothetical protein
LAAAELNSTTN